MPFVGAGREDGEQAALAGRLRDLRLLAMRHLGQDISDLPLDERTMRVCEDAVAMRDLAIDEQSQAIIKAWNAIQG